MPTKKKDRREQELPVDDDRRADDQDRRKSHRILVDLEVDYQCEDTFLFAYITDMSAFGIFIRTNNPEPPGTHLNLRFRLPEGAETLALEGEVIWINPFRPGDFNNLNPGMGVKFVDLTPDLVKRLMDLIRRVAYLEDDTDTEQKDGGAAKEEGKEEEEAEEEEAPAADPNKN
jgi:type IV pilus assembly protein PilZ